MTETTDHHEEEETPMSRWANENPERMAEIAALPPSQQNAALRAAMGGPPRIERPAIDQQALGDAREADRMAARAGLNPSGAPAPANTRPPTREQDEVAEAIASRYGRARVTRVPPMGVGAVLVEGMTGDEVRERVRVLPDGTRTDPDDQGL